MEQTNHSAASPEIRCFTYLAKPFILLHVYGSIVSLRMKKTGFTPALVLLLCMMLPLTGVFAQARKQAQQKPATNKQPVHTMKVEIWSDVMCPFCYIGKRKFEAALAQFEHKDHVEVVWKSFQLNPDLKTDPSRNTVAHLAESKGWTLAYAKEMTSHVTAMAKEVGLHYDFDKAVVANSFDAHRVVQYAKTKGKGDAMEEQLFKAYFIDGKNTADHATLAQLAAACGLDENEVSKVLASGAFADEVKADIHESRQIGVTGVPFFVLNNKYAVSGAQQPETFLGALQKAWSELPQSSSSSNPATGAVCAPDGTCE
jgi:predicted DsbA family dithiol-disulfide isomerase